LKCVYNIVTTPGQPIRVMIQALVVFIVIVIVVIETGQLRWHNVLYGLPTNGWAPDRGHCKGQKSPMSSG